MTQCIFGAGRSNTVGRELPNGWSSPRGEPGYRWGSCGRNDILFFNWKLMQPPPHLIDYVVAHELAHLLEPHHAPEFWSVLDRAMPDWRERREELRMQVRCLYWCHCKPSTNARRQGSS